MAVLLVEHDMEMVRTAVDRVVVLDVGEIIAAGHLRTGRGRPRGAPGLPGTNAHERPTILELDNVSAVLQHLPRPVRRVARRPRQRDHRPGRLERRREVDPGPGGVGPRARPAGARSAFEGEDVTRWPAHRIARLGVAHVPEGRAIFSTLSVEENLTVSFSRRVGRKETPDALARAYEAFPVLAERRRQLGGTLSGGQQRILSLAKVLAVPPKLLIVDELSLGLAPVIVDQVYDGLVAIHEQGCALLVVEQQVDRVLAIADRAVLLVKGAVAWEGPARDARADPRGAHARRGGGQRVGARCSTNGSRPAPSACRAPRASARCVRHAVRPPGAAHPRLRPAPPPGGTGRRRRPAPPSGLATPPRVAAPAVRGTDPTRRPISGWCDRTSRPRT